jgi:Mannosyl-glycoprotein endo-beta-N-acetylglucosaminidase
MVKHPRRHRLVLSCALAALVVVGAACVPPAAPTGRVPIMGASALTPLQLWSWFTGRSPQPSGPYAASVDAATLAHLYVTEGNAEGVAGDVAFIQGIVETGWYRFTGSVPAWKNNFAGIGATDTNPAPASFPDARTGVRAQIQHLRAYGDASAGTCTIPPLHNPCVDPRFSLVAPKGKAPTWNVMGNGNWASSTTYSSSILRLYNEARAFNGLPPA